MDVETKKATYETSNMAVEMGDFVRYTSARRVLATIFDKTNGASTGYSQRLNGSANEKCGIAQSISVMPGDVIDMEVYAKYVDTNSANWTPALNALMGQIASGSSSVVFDGANYSTSTATFPYHGYLTTSPAAGAPKAYLNWLIFDRETNFITGGYRPITTDSREHGQDVAHERLFNQITITEPGYVYIYLSNEETSPVEVYFDEFKVTQTKSPVIQTQDYYPFGLTFNSYSRENSIPNMFKFNGKEEQTELSLAWLDYGARMYMPEIGRWGIADPKAELLEMSSPYVYSLNSPINFIDPDGELPIYINGRVTSDSQRGDASYWDAEILNTVRNSGIPNPGGQEFFVDGDRWAYSWKANDGMPISAKGNWTDSGNLPSGRHAAGYYEGRRDFKKILSMLERDPESGKIIEKIQIYSHSRGASFATGYVESLLELIKENADQFEDPSSVIDFVFHMGPHQSQSLHAFSDNEYADHHNGDALSGNKMEGVKGTFSSKQKGSGVPVIGPHSTSSFVKDVNAFLKSFQSSGKDSKKLIKNFVNTMKREYNIDVTVE